MAAPAAGGKADTGLGESDDEDDDEEDDMGHSRGFMSWRLRQKAVTCSVLCAEKEEETEHVIICAFVEYLGRRSFSVPQGRAGLNTTTVYSLPTSLLFFFDVR